MSIKYAYLGPAGTFTEAALLKITDKSDQLTAYANVTATLDAIRKGECQKALVPIENSVEGVVARTLDELAIGEPLVITGEITLPVEFSLMALAGTDPKNIKAIATHPHAESQCRTYIAKNYPNATIIETTSTAAAAKGLIKKEYEAAIVAIADATSPPACPPIPSATAIKFSLINAESSLPSRTKPRSVCAKELNCQVIEPISPHIWVNDIYSVYVGNKWGEK